MIKFIIAKGKIVLSPEIVLFKELESLYKEKDGQKYLQVIYYLYSRDSDNSFRDLSRLVVEENVLQAVFNKRSWSELKMSRSLEKKYELAKNLFIEYTSTTESRLEESMNKKLDEIAMMLDTIAPVIDQSVVPSGETKFNTNLTIILNLFSKVEGIMKSKGVLRSAILRTEAVGKVRGGGTTSFRERGLKHIK